MRLLGIGGLVESFPGRARYSAHIQRLSHVVSERVSTDTGSARTRWSIHADRLNRPPVTHWDHARGGHGLRPKGHLRSHIMMGGCPNITLTINTYGWRDEALGMPHGQDIENDPDYLPTYECLQCGTILEAESHPGSCECGGDFQNRAKSLE